MTKRTWIVAGALVATMVATVGVAQAQGAWNAGNGTAAGDGARYGMMGRGSGANQATGQANGQGMMMGRRQGAGQANGQANGQGMMMGRGQGIGQANAQGTCTGANYDPAAILTRTESMLERNQAVRENLKTQLAAAQDDTVKAALTARIEWQQIQNGWLEARLPVVKALPEDWLTGAITLAKQDVEYFGKATAEDANNQARIANRLTAAQERLANLEAQEAGTQKAN